MVRSRESGEGAELSIGAPYSGYYSDVHSGIRMWILSTGVESTGVQDVDIGFNTVIVSGCGIRMWIHSYSFYTLS